MYSSPRIELRTGNEHCSGIYLKWKAWGRYPSGFETAHLERGGGVRGGERDKDGLDGVSMNLRSRYIDWFDLIDLILV